MAFTGLLGIVHFEWVVTAGGGERLGCLVIVDLIVGSREFECVELIELRQLDVHERLPEELVFGLLSSLAVSVHSCTFFFSSTPGMQ